MSYYIRPRMSGATVFFTACLADRSSVALVSHIEQLRVAVRQTMARHPFEILTWVTLPDHIHCIWKLPEGDRDLGVRWGSIKSRFTRSVKVGSNPTLRQQRSASQKAKGDAGLWQRRFWDHHIRDEQELANLTHHCWTNPVKHGLVDASEDWPYSSIHRDKACRLVA